MRKPKAARSFLIQRLNKPVVRDGGADACSAFGVGEYAGLPAELSGPLGQIFTLDYMGSAEFEFGALGRTLQSICNKSEQGKLTCEVLTLPVQPDWESVGKQICNATFYIIQPKNLQELGHAKKIIEDQANEEIMRFKEPMKLKKAVFADKYSKGPIGWLELDNGFFIFLDYEAFAKTAKLFCLNIPDPNAAFVEPSQDRGKSLNTKRSCAKNEPHLR